MVNLTWDTSGEWDSERDSAGMVHDGTEDHPGAGTLSAGYDYDGPAALHSTLYGSNLVGWWPLTGTSGDARDLSGDGNHGTVSGATRGIGGRGGLTAYSFDGSDDSVNIGTGPSDGMTNWSFSVWFLTRDASKTGGQDLYTTDAAGNNSGDGGLVLGDDQVLDFVVDWNSGGGSAVGPTISDNTWYHVVGVSDSSADEARIYVNGALEGTESGASGNFGGSGQDLIFGTNMSGNRRLDGLLCDARLYSTDLTTTQIETLYEFGSRDLSLPPDDNDGGVSYYPFNSSNANDAWGSNDGTVNGATYVSDGGPRGDGAYSFDGSDDYIDIGNFGLGSSTSFTISHWQKSDADGGTAVGRWDGSTDILQLQGGPTFQFRLGHYQGNEHVINYETSTTDVWNHCVGVYDSSSGTSYLYVNGILVSSDDSAIADFSDTQPIYIGNRGGSSGPYDGDIDDVRIYNRALEPWEVAELYQYGTLGIDMRKHMVNKR